jgi:hypothetical protein
MIGMNTNDLFLLILVLPGVVDVTCVGHVLVAPCVGFVLAFTGVVKSKSLPRFTNVGHKRGLLGPKDCEKSSKLIYVVWIYGLVELKNFLVLLRNVIFSK